MFSNGGNRLLQLYLFIIIALPLQSPQFRNDIGTKVDQTFDRFCVLILIVSRKSVERICHLGLKGAGILRASRQNKKRYKEGYYLKSDFHHDCYCSFYLQNSKYSSFRASADV